MSGYRSKNLTRGLRNGLPAFSENKIYCSMHRNESKRFVHIKYSIFSHSMTIDVISDVSFEIDLFNLPRIF